MKKLLLLLCVIGVFAACEDIQDNRPTLQAEIDDVFFKSLGTAANINEDNTVIIQASGVDETLTLVLSSVGEGTFELGGTSASVATFQDASGNLYSTAEEGSGAVTISSIDPSTTISGSFNFSAILPGIDTLVAQKGLFFEVPFTASEIEEPGGTGDPSLEGSFVAEIDGNLFDPTTIVSSATDTSIIINAALGDDTIQLVIPLDAVPGSQAIPGDGYSATYFISGDEEVAISGSIRVFEHDMAEQTISGTFNFMTENHQISLGQFSISY